MPSPVLRKFSAGCSTATPICPEDKRMEFRVGVTLGDVIVEGDDIFGDGVNVAARLEAIADPGGLAISATARDHVDADST